MRDMTTPFVITMLAFSATGHHWWLDGVAAIALVVIAIRIDGWARRRLG